MPQLVVCMSANVKTCTIGERWESEGDERMGRHRRPLEEQRRKRKETETREQEERKTKIIGRKDETNMAEDRGKYQSTRSGGEGGAVY